MSLTLKAEIDSEANVVKVNVSGNRAKEDITVNPARITVYLVENNINDRAQAGAGPDFVHQHVVRKVNSDWGEVLEWNGNDYSYDCQLDLRADYVLDNLQVIAMIYDYDQNDATLSEVANAAALSYADFTTDDIRSINAEDSEQVVYDLQGRRMSGDKLPKGLYIINGRKQVVK